MFIHVAIHPIIDNYLTNVIKKSIHSNDIDSIIEGGRCVITDVDSHANIVVSGKYLMHN